MYNQDQEDSTIYKVVVNHEEQYSIWPVERENALGWRNVGKSGIKKECSGLYQRNLDRYAPAQPAKEDGSRCT
jgi:uncharacterized protein YbdZ (MbtH family)